MGIYGKIFSNPNEEDTANVVRASHWAQYLKWTLEPKVCPEKEWSDGEHSANLMETIENEYFSAEKQKIKKSHDHSFQIMKGC